jgi:glycosyltransferase involved in cell wall biosynthesis
MDRLLSKRTHRILVGAPQVRDFTIQQEKLPPDKVVVVFDGADLTFSDIKEGRSDILRKMDLLPDYLYVVAVGRFVEQKGHRYLVEAWKRVVDHYNGSGKKLKLIIFGIGELKEEIARQIEEAGLQDDILTPGIAPMNDIMAISDIFSLLSLWEGFSIALIQAMNAKCPIVASAVSGTVDAIRSNEEGLLVEPKDSKAAAEAMIKLIDDPELRKTLGENANKRSEIYHIKNRIKEIEAIITDFFENGGKSV